MMNQTTPTTPAAIKALRDVFARFAVAPLPPKPYADKRDRRLGLGRLPRRCEGAR